MLSFWECLEEVPSLVAVPRTWHDCLGTNFDVVARSFLRATNERARSYPCPNHCGCAHEVAEHEDGSLVAVCQCEPWRCDDVLLSPADVILLELNWQRLGRAIARAFGCDLKEDDLLPNTMQIASFSGATLPIILTIQNEAEQFRSIVGQLVALLRRPFVLLGPTTRLVKAPALGFLEGVKAEFFDLESHLSLLPSGVLAPRRSAGELFSHLVGTEQEVSAKQVKKLFELFQKLSIRGQSQRKGKIDAVFWLLVFQHRRQASVAEELKCSESVISKRVREIEAFMGLRLEQLKAFGSRLYDMEVERNPQARRRYDKGLVE
jgi:hypothetical protein